MPGGDEERRQGRVAEKGEARPVPVLVAQVPVTLRQHKRVPIVVHAPGRALGVELQEVPGLQRIPGEQLEPELPVPEGQFGGKDDFAIVVAMDRDLVVLNMAGTKPDMVPPAEKREYPQKEFIQHLCLEGCPVHEFMAGGATKEAAERAVREQCDEKQGHGPDPIAAVNLKEGQVGQRTRNDTQPQVTQSLTQPLQVAPLYQILHHRRINPAAIPFDSLVLVVFLSVAHGRI